MASHASQSMSFLSSPENFGNASVATKHVCDGFRGCGKEFSGVKTYENHIRQCSQTLPETCCLCELQLHPKRLRTHLEQTHHMECDKCKRVFQRTDKLVEHVAQCGSVFVSCCICMLQVDASTLQSHLETSHGMQCNRCQRVFDRPVSLQKHVQSCRGGFIPCPFGNGTCQIPVNQVNSDAGWEHVAEHLKMLVCPFCFEDFSCKKAFVSVTGFVLHWKACRERTEQRGEKPSCDRCLEQFESQYFKNKHVANPFECVPGSERRCQVSWFDLFAQTEGLTAMLRVEPSAFSSPRELYVRIQSNGVVEPLSQVPHCIAMEFLNGDTSGEKNLANFYSTKLVGLNVLDQSRGGMSSSGMLYSVLTTRLVQWLLENLEVFQLSSCDEVYNFCDNILAQAAMPVEASVYEIEHVLRSSAKSLDVGEAVFKQEAFQERVVYDARASDHTFVVPIQNLLKRIVRNVKVNDCRTHELCVREHGKKKNHCARKKEVVYTGALPRLTPYGEVEASKSTTIELQDESYLNCVYLWFRDVFTEVYQARRASDGLTFVSLMSQTVNQTAVEWVANLLLTKCSSDVHDNAESLRTLVFDGLGKALVSPEKSLRRLRRKFGSGSCK